MRKAIIFFSFLLVFCSRGSSQYTPLPALDENLYAKFIERLRTEAKLQDIPELNTMADNMSYNEARKFLAHPYLYMHELRSEKEGQEGKPKMNHRVFGIIAALLLNNLTGLDSYSDGQSKIGFALGAYAMWALGKIYFLSELLFQYSQFGEKGAGTGNNWTETYKENFISLFTLFLYSIEMQSMRLLLGAGPAFGFALSGKDTYKDTGGEVEEDFQFGSNDWRHFYFGLSLAVGIMTAKNFLIYLAYTLPLTTLHGDWDAKLSIFRLAFGIPLSRQE